MPDLELAKSAVLNSLTSIEAQRGYSHAINEFVDWYCSEPRLAFNRVVVLRYRSHLESRQLAAGTINLRLGAVRRLAYEAADSGLLSADLAAGIHRVHGVRRLGVRLGNWLTADQGKALWQAQDTQRLKGKRDRALLVLLLACGLRRREVTTLRLRDLEQRKGHWAIVDMVGKGGHIRTVPIPDWVREQLEDWIMSAGIREGKIFRKVDRLDRIWGEELSVKAVWHIVKDSAKGVGLPNIAPHDLRRSCARLCQSAGGELEQIQFLLGHVSIQTTERYAVTSHSSQGLTAERVLVNADTGVHPDLLNSRFGYVAISRASHDATLFTDDMSKLSPQLSAEISKTSALQFDQASSIEQGIGSL